MSLAGRGLTRARANSGLVGERMRLSLETRDVGRVTIVRCNGRIVTGGESESLRAHVAWLLRDRKAIILHLGEVAFVDSSGLGTIVRTLTSVRQKGGDLKLCNVPEHTRKVLAMTNLITLFDTHDSEESAVSAFYRAPSTAEQPAHNGISVLCVDRNVDVLAYLRELLRRAGYDVHSSKNVPDALILMKVTDFRLLLLGPDLTASPATQQAFERACAKVPVLPLGNEFSGTEAGEATAGLLEKIAACLNAGSSKPS
jgi:anti-sigma B factor antagonist